MINENNKWLITITEHKPIITGMMKLFFNSWLHRLAAPDWRKRAEANMFLSFFFFQDTRERQPEKPHPHQGGRGKSPRLGKQKPRRPMT